MKHNSFVTNEPNQVLTRPHAKGYGYREKNLTEKSGETGLEPIFGKG